MGREIFIRGERVCLIFNKDSPSKLHSGEKFRFETPPLSQKPVKFLSLSLTLRSFQSFLARLVMMMLFIFLLILLLILIVVAVFTALLFLLRVPWDVFHRVFLSVHGEDFTVAASALGVDGGGPLSVRTSDGVTLKLGFLE